MDATKTTNNVYAGARRYFVRTTEARNTLSCLWSRVYLYSKVPRISNGVEGVDAFLRSAIYNGVENPVQSYKKLENLTGDLYSFMEKSHKTSCRKTY